MKTLAKLGIVTTALFFSLTGNAQQTIDPEPSKATTELLSEIESYDSHGTFGCAMNVIYPGQVAQLVDWTHESCSKLTIAFLSLSDLKKMGKLPRLSEEVKDDLLRMKNGRVLYIEGEAASAIYPLNVFDRVYTAWISD